MLTMLSSVSMRFANIHAKLSRDEEGDGWTYILVILGVLVLTAILVLAFVGPFRTQVMTLMNNVLNYFSNLNSNLTAPAVLS